MILITSGAFISDEFQVELGKLPPALMPLGNKRLFEHQVASLHKSFADTDIYLSITDAYHLRATDALLLEELNIKLIWVPNGLSLGDSLLYVINSIGRYDEVFRVLHGDTYMTTFPKFEDVVALSEVDDEYNWEVEFESDTSEKVWCGFFSFSDIKHLARSLAAARGDFVKAVRIYQKDRPQQFPVISEWFDLGHVNTYFRSRAKVTTQRSFNDLCIENGIVIKTSQQSIKIQAEAHWFSYLPHNLKRYVPQLIHQGTKENKYFYELEYLPHLPLNELYVHGSLPLTFWRKIFVLTNKLLNHFYLSTSLSEDTKNKIQLDFIKLLTDKTEKRLSKYANENCMEVNKPTEFNKRVLPSLSQIVAECQAAAFKLPAKPGILHGDFCFSNILYDSRSDSLKLLDPRGLDANQEFTIYGDLRYDIAKFAHSVIGGYDHIIAGLFTLKEVSSLNFEFEIHVDEISRSIIGYFEKYNLLGISIRDILPLVTLLFISMLPLHADNPARQRAFLANSLRMYTLWKEEKCL